MSTLLPTLAGEFGDGTRPPSLSMVESVSWAQLARRAGAVAERLGRHARCRIRAANTLDTVVGVVAGLARRCAGRADARRRRADGARAHAARLRRGGDDR